MGRILKRGKKQGTELVCPSDTPAAGEGIKSPRKRSMSKYLPAQVKRAVSPSSPFPGVSLHNDHAPPPVFVQQDRSELSNFLIGDGTRQPVVRPCGGLQGREARGRGGQNTEKERVSL